MTAPAQPPDPRVQRIAQAITPFDVGSNGYSYALARVLVEELGGREATVRGDDEPRTIWRQVMDALEVESNGDAVKKALTLRAQQRENAETIQALRERVETAEAANTELDHARKSAEQSARDLRENNATLRAELDAIKGAQPSVQFESDGWPNPMTITHDGEHFVVRSAKSSVWFYDTYNELLKHWRSAEPQRATIMTLRHPAPALPAKGDGCEFCLGAKGGVEGNGNRFNGILVCDYCTALLLDAKKSPALPVVGACVMNDKGEVTHRWSDRWLARDMDVLEVIARKENGTLYKLLLGDKIGAPLPTEGGK